MGNENAQPAEAEIATTAEPAERPKGQKFRKRFGMPRLAPDAAERQGRVTMRAWKRLGGRDGAIAFLNAHHDGLGGRPLDLAVISEEACRAVEQAIDQHPVVEPAAAQGA